MSVVSVLSGQELEQLATRANVQRVAAEMLTHEQVEIPVFHTFRPGIYLREIHIPKDTITVGKIHKFSCINFLTKGERTTLIGGYMVRIKAPHVHCSPPGHQRLSITHEDSVWITAHFTDEQDIKRLEHDLVAETEEEYQDFIKLLTMETSRCLS